MVTLFTRFLDYYIRLLGGGGFGDAGDEVERWLDVISGAGTVGLEMTRGGFGVIPA